MLIKCALLCCQRGLIPGESDARLYYLRSSREWVGRGHMVENEVGFDLGRGAALTALVLIVLAWYSPRVVRTLTPGSTENLTLTADIQRFRERFEKAVSALRSPSPMTIESLGGTMGLGRGTPLSDEIVMYAIPSGGQHHATRRSPRHKNMTRRTGGRRLRNER